MDKGQFMAVVSEVGDLVDKKNRDYQGKFVQLEEYFPFGSKSYVQMIWVKALRLRSLSQESKVPQFESLEDTCNDIIAYAVFMKDYLNKAKACKVEANK